MRVLTTPEVGDRVQTDSGAGVITNIHRPGTMRARYNVKLDEPIEDVDELIDVIDVGLSELEVL